MKVTSRAVLLALTLALAGGFVRLQGLSRSLEHDEVVTVREYAAKPWTAVVTSYDAPNNHILHTLLLKLATSCLGDDEWVIRFPAWAAAALGIGALYYLAWSFSGSRLVSLLACGILTVSPVHIDYARQARGYTLLILFAVVAGFCLHRALDAGSARWKWWTATVISGFLAAYAVPSGLYLIAALLLGGAVILALEYSESGDDAERASILTNAKLLGAAATILLALIAAAYGPLYRDIVESSQRWGHDLRSDPGILWTLIVDVFKQTAPSRWRPISAVFGVVGLLALWRDNRRAGILCIGAIVVPFIINLLSGFAGPARVYLFVLPFALTLIACGARELASRLATVAPGTAGRMDWVLAAVGLAIVASYASPTSWKAPRDNHYKQIGEFIRERTADGDIIVAPYVMDVCISYYSDHTPERRIWSVWSGNPWHQLLFVATDADPRFELSTYTLTTNYTDPGGQYLRALNLPEKAFELVGRTGPVGVYRFKQSRHRVGDIGILIDGNQWSINYESSPGEVRLGFDPHRGISGAGALHIESRPPDVRFALHSKGSFQVPLDGVFVLSYAKSAGPETYATLCEISDEEPTQCQPLQMVKPLNLIRDADGGSGRWYGEFSFAPITAGTRYGVYLYGSSAKEIYYSDFKGDFIPFETH